MGQVGMETDADVGHTKQAEGAAGAAPSAGAATQMKALFAHGIPDVIVVANLIAKYPGEQNAFLGWLHASVGNRYVQSVTTALGAAAPSASVATPVQLNPNVARPPKSPIPNISGEDLEARAEKSEAQSLLKSTDLSSGENARKAMEILIAIDDDHRGRMIDELDDKAFENLLDRVPDHERERFTKLVAVSKRPERKMLLWAAFHKSHAENDLARYKGDAGKDTPLHKSKDEEGKDVWEEDDDEKAAIEAGYTKAQMLNRKRHDRRTKAVDSTKDEVDSEVKRLMAKAKTGKLTLDDVNEMSDRKDLEYQIELENNVNLTASGVDAKGKQAQWSKTELESVRTTLSRLPQVRNPDAFETLERRPYRQNWMDGVGGETSGGDRIEIYDWGAQQGGGFRHGGDEREMVSDEFKHEHGNKISAQEFVLTHEIGHDVAHQDPKAFDAMTTAAGWHKVKVDELRKDGVAEGDLALLESRRTNPNENGGAEVRGQANTYAPIAGGDEYWAAPQTAIPAQNESAPSSHDGGDSWLYATVNPEEHFAEIYAKAVHVPEKLHDELVDRPTAAAREARKKVEIAQQQLADQTARSTKDEQKIAVMTSRLASLKAEAASKDTAKQQRGDEFRIMRSDVFHTDQAVAIALERLKTKKISAAQLAAFEERAAAASTPEQIAFLEKEATK